MPSFRLQIHSPPTSTHVTAEFELPGISDADIVITIESDGKLTVSGERAVPDVWHSGDSYPVREFKYGKFKRVVDIPIGLKVWQIHILHLVYTMCLSACPPRAFELVTLADAPCQSQHITAELQQGILSLKWPHTVPLSPEKGAS